LRKRPAGWVFALSALPLALVVLPLGALAWRGLGAGAAALARPMVTEALWLSLWTSIVALCLSVALGTPVAWLLARSEFRGRRILDTLVDLPMVLPPAVAGIGLLLAFSRQGLLDLAFSPVAVVLAQVFVASPFYVRAAKAGFGGVDPALEQVAATLGQSPTAIFGRVTIPLALPGLIGGAVVTWARALGEFGATIFFAGNLPGVTQTMPLAIYSALETDLDAAVALALILVVASALLLFTFKRVTRGA